MLSLVVATLASLLSSAVSIPEQPASLVCSGTQSAYRDDVTSGGAVTKLSLPWSRTYTVYLQSKRYCESRCRPDATLDAVDADHLVMGDIEYGPQSTRLTYKAADNSIYGHQVTPISGTAAVHLETSGTCSLAAGAPAASGIAASASKASVAGP